MSSAVVDVPPSAEPERAPRRVPPWWTWPIAAAVIFAAALAGVLFAPVGTTVAVWWPAAGLSVLFAILQPASRLPAAVLLVLAVTMTANLVAGRPPALSIGFGIANAAEVAVVSALLGWGRRDFRLSTIVAGVRFAAAAAAGGIVAGILGAAAIALLSGAAPWPVAGFIAASHAAAVGMIAPFALLPRRLPVRATRAEMAVQALALAVVIGIVFHPDTALPLTFAPYPLLAWAAFRFPIRVVLLETLLAALAMLALTLAGGGVLGAPTTDALTGAALLEVFLVTFTGLAVVLTAAQYELRATGRQLEASTRLLTGSVIDARVGLAIVHRDASLARLTWANRVARELLAPELDGDRWDGPTRAAAARALATEEQATVVDTGGRTITVAANRIHGDEELFAVQLLDVTAILQAQQARADADVEAAAARTIRAELERQRDDFLATTSHELRTPITSIVGFAELVAESDAVAETERSWLAVIERNAQRLSELVEDLLTLSGGATAPPRPQTPERVDCAAVLAEVAAGQRLVSDGKGLAVEIDAGAHVVLASRSDVERAVSNLLANAIKFTPQGGGIRLSAERDAAAGEVVVEVADTGPGMSDEELVHAFDRFYRAPAAERANIPGTGLGLSIVAELARRNGGSAALRRNAAGGITASLRLPSAP
ncbi:sensor histidine kinase [Agrococcus sediminis]|uniref:sensor histidine kinase n=1 Tax=Agrococcus sediminis TaxID=2599924 RepID=UPI0034148EE5